MRPALAPLLALLIALGPGPARAAGDRDDPGGLLSGSGVSLADRITSEQQEAIDRGLAWLAGRQLEDGSYPTAEGVDANRARTAVTALATLAFLGAGHGLRHGPYRESVRKGVEWLLRTQVRSGEHRGYVRYPSDNTSKMHGHGFATLALAEAYGTAGDAGGSAAASDPRKKELRELSKNLREGVQAAVELIERSQSLQGGWYYTPDQGGTTQHEGSVTVCMVQALVAASNRGFRVDLGRVKLARKYMKDSQARSGGFRYKLDDVKPHDGPLDDSYTYSLTAAGVTSLLGLGEYDRREAIERGLRYMERKDPLPHPDRTPYFYYGAFYAVQAFHWAGGERWRKFWIPVRGQILGDQILPEGRWVGRDANIHLGDAYPTAMSLLMLEVPVGYLSIFAR